MERESGREERELEERSRIVNELTSQFCVEGREVEKKKRKERKREKWYQLIYKKREKVKERKMKKKEGGREGKRESDREKIRNLKKSKERGAGHIRERAL